MADFQVGDMLTIDSTVDDLPGGVPQLFVEMNPNGSRRIIRAVALSIHSFTVWKSILLASGNSITVWGPNDIPILLGLHPGQYLPYPVNGIPVIAQPEPVNPYGIGPKWLNVISRFAHDLMEFNPHTNHLRNSGTHDSGHLPPSDAATQLKNKMTYQLGRAVVGVAWNRVKHWMTLDAEKLALQPGMVTDRESWTIWRDGRIPNHPDEIPIPNMNQMMTAICGDDVTNVQGLCIGEWVYLLNHRIDASSYDANMNSGGEIRLPDMSRETWHPNLYLHRVTGTRSERSDQWDEIMGWFRNAHDHYLENVAPGIEH